MNISLTVRFGQPLKPEPVLDVVIKVRKGAA